MLPEERAKIDNKIEQILEDATDDTPWSHPYVSKDKARMDIVKFIEEYLEENYVRK